MKREINLLIQSSLALALTLTAWLPTTATAADEPMKPVNGGEHPMINHTDGWMNGWMGGGMWLWTVIGVAVVVLLVIVIANKPRR